MPKKSKGVGLGIKAALVRIKNRVKVARQLVRDRLCASFFFCAGARRAIRSWLVRFGAAEDDMQRTHALALPLFPVVRFSCCLSALEVDNFSRMNGNESKEWRQAPKKKRKRDA